VLADEIDFLRRHLLARRPGDGHVAVADVDFVDARSTRG